MYHPNTLHVPLKYTACTTQMHWMYHPNALKNMKATLEQKKADENVLRLATDQRREKVKLHKRIIDLEKKLDAKQALDLEIERLRGSLQVVKHMGENGDMDMKIKMDNMQEELKEKEEELDALAALNQALVVKERKSNDELQEARKELISNFRDRPSRAIISVKQMGDLDTKPFQEAMKRKYSGNEADEKPLELCSLWEDNLKDPTWHPFKFVHTGVAAQIQRMYHPNALELLYVWSTTQKHRGYQLLEIASDLPVFQALAVPLFQAFREDVTITSTLTRFRISHCVIWPRKHIRI